jgi:hypothetical protein
MTYIQTIQGTATLVGGTVTVANTSVASTSQIFVTPINSSITNVGSVMVKSQTAGTGFVIQSSNPLDTSVVNWQIVN